MMFNLLERLRRRRQWRSLRNLKPGATFTTREKLSDEDVRSIQQQWKRHSPTGRVIVCSDDNERAFWRGWKLILLAIILYVVGHAAVTFIRWNW